MFKPLAAAGLALLLAGCVQPIVKTTGPLAITRVDINAAPTLKAHTDLLPQVRQTVPAQLVGAHPGKPAVLDLTLVDVHYKNPVASLLVGDSNHLTAKGVLRAEDGTEITRFDARTSDQGAINGIAGAVISVAQDRARVDRAMARELAKDLERRIYGKVTREPAQLELAPKVGAPAVPAAPAAVPARAAPRVGAPKPLPKGAAGV